jgi:hypothetical protein
MELPLNNSIGTNQTAKDSNEAIAAPPKLARELTRVEARHNQLWNEFAAHAEEMTERAARRGGRAASRRARWRFPRAPRRWHR